MKWKFASPVSIPQAVSTVATGGVWDERWSIGHGFNTASGKHCCNQFYIITLQLDIKIVSIPQAVSTVATVNVLNTTRSFKTFQYRKR